MNKRITGAITIAINSEDKQALMSIAAQYGCFWGEIPNVSELVRKIATGELAVVPQQPSQAPTQAVNLPKVPRYTALCPHPIQGFLEAVGDSESSALTAIHQMLEDTALSGESLSRLMGEAVVLESSDPRLPGYRMMLIVSG